MPDTSKENPWCLLFIRESVPACVLHDGVEIRRIVRIAMLSITSENTTDFEINPCPKHADSYAAGADHCESSEPPAQPKIKNLIKNVADVVGLRGTAMSFCLRILFGRFDSALVASGVLLVGVSVFLIVGRPRQDAALGLAYLFFVLFVVGAVSAQIVVANSQLLICVFPSSMSVICLRVLAASRRGRRFPWLRGLF
ncbi:unnamed protein product [Schistocephalus solidus]|uniref:MMPL domain-containing protein n=1 Tax=Schistocephalus solidus TaxID=70667 RepID=A0A183T4W9_SCHSO|nr:unnamed protein product [Schistocephalus solidus]